MCEVVEEAGEADARRRLRLKLDSFLLVFPFSWLLVGLFSSLFPATYYLLLAYLVFFFFFYISFVIYSISRGVFCCCFFFRFFTLLVVVG
jgi:hypothetical protein